MIEGLGGAVYGVGWRGAVYGGRQEGYLCTVYESHPAPYTALQSPPRTSCTALPKLNPYIVHCTPIASRPPVHRTRYQANLQAITK